MVKLYLIYDSENAANNLVYQLSIAGIPTPYLPTSGGNAVEFFLTDKFDVPTYRSNNGYFNMTPPIF